MTSLPSVVIADTSCLILLDKIGCLELLPKLFVSCLITPVVAAEYGLLLPEWLRVEAPTHTQPLVLASYQLDAGAYSALALALEQVDCLLVLDDNAARRAASHLALPHTGTVGLLLLAKTRGLLPAVRPVLAELQTAGMWLAEAVVERVCREAGE